VIIEKSIEDENYRIYPMLLLPLIENAYKYGASSQSVSNPIEIHIVQKNKQLLFTIKNQKLNTNLNLDKNYSGVGISTLKKNLSLVYPKRHSFKIDQTKDYFQASLTINSFE
jgi:LytS/YehU family sensor histidine kinase